MRRFRVGKPFDVQIEEEDRQTAGHYDNVSSCLMATAVRRTVGEGHYVSAGVFCVVIDGNNYFCSGGFQPDALGWNPKASSRPCYDPSVVGKVFTFVPR
jgi:hypothetical protein